MPTILDGYIPTDLGMPTKFAAFRPIQCEAVEYALTDEHELDRRRVTAMGIAAGGGKSLLCQTIARLAGVKSVTLTATRSLEDQYMDDRYVGLVNVRGRSNYDCITRSADTPDTVRDCQTGDEEGCPESGTDRCTYRQCVRRASDAPNDVTNYQFWLNVRARNWTALDGKPVEQGGSGPVRLLICDEFHTAMAECARFLGVWVGANELSRWGQADTQSVIAATRGAESGKVTQSWVEALTAAWARVEARRAHIVAEHDDNEAAARRGSKEFRRLTKLADNLARVTEHGTDGNWLWRLTKSGTAFECVWPARYAERYLFSGVERIVCVSATLRPKALQLVGLRPSDYRFREWARVFPPQNSPVYWVPTGRMGQLKAHPERVTDSVARFDQIFEEWGGDRKGIVHTPSYALAEQFQAQSKYGRYMHLNRAGESATDAADRFRASAAPSVLVSPSFSTGWDFPDEACEWQVIPKLPFADLTDPVVAARRESDPQWYDYECMQKLVQACGRGTRHDKDKCVTMITDDAVQRFRNYAREHAPRWVRVMDAPGGKVPRAPR
jgi:Rad3-related DNA helicase